jgi:hypothetical protein
MGKMSCGRAGLAGVLSIGIALLTASTAQAQAQTQTLTQISQEKTAARMIDPGGPGAEVLESSDANALKWREWSAPGDARWTEPSRRTVSGSTPVRQGQKRASGSLVIKRVLAGAALGAAGFFAGGVIGANLEGNCHCDDPGLRGALIGAPIGAAVGATLGVLMVR